MAAPGSLGPRVRAVGAMFEPTSRPGQPPVREFGRRRPPASTWLITGQTCQPSGPAGRSVHDRGVIGLGHAPLNPAYSCTAAPARRSTGRRRPPIRAPACCSSSGTGRSRVDLRGRCRPRAGTPSLPTLGTANTTAGLLTQAQHPHEIDRERPVPELNNKPAPDGGRLRPVLLRGRCSGCSCTRVQRRHDEADDASIMNRAARRT